MREYVANAFKGASTDAALRVLFECSPMIVGVSKPLRLGEIIGIKGHPFKVMRKSSLKEFRASHSVNQRWGDESRYYYEVATD